VNDDAWLTVPVIPTLYRPLALPRSATIPHRRRSGHSEPPFKFILAVFITNTAISTNLIVVNKIVLSDARHLQRKTALPVCAFPTTEPPISDSVSRVAISVVTRARIDTISSLSDELDKTGLSSTDCRSTAVPKTNNEQQLKVKPMVQL
jgi:hypothetical protein